MVATLSKFLAEVGRETFARWRPVRDRRAPGGVLAGEKAERFHPDHIAAPFTGVVTVEVAAGDEVTAGQTIATIEAMKMEAAVTAPKAGRVSRVAVSTTAQVEGGDLLAVVI